MVDFGAYPRGQYSRRLATDLSRFISGDALGSMVRLQATFKSKHLLNKLKPTYFECLDTRENSLDRRPRLSKPHLKLHQLCKLKG